MRSTPINRRMRAATDSGRPGDGAGGAARRRLQRPSLACGSYQGTRRRELRGFYLWRKITEEPQLGVSSKSQAVAQVMPKLALRTIGCQLVSASEKGSDCWVPPRPRRPYPRLFDPRSVSRDPSMETP